MDGIVRLCTTPGPSRPVDSMWGVLVVPPTGEHGGGSAALWPLVGRDVAVVDDRRRALVRNARAFGPGGRWCGGMPFVPSDRRRGRRGARLWPLAGRCLVVPCDQCRALLRNVGSSLVIGSQPGGGTCPLDVVGGSIPSCRCVDVGWYGGAYAVPLSRVSARHWGLGAYWRHGVGWHPCPPSHWVWPCAVVVVPGSWRAPVVKIASRACA